MASWGAAELGAPYHAHGETNESGDFAAFTLFCQNYFSLYSTQDVTVVIHTQS